MSQQLISLSPDLLRLQQEGYEISVHGGYSCIHHVPYVTAQKEVHFGTLITTLSLAGNRTARPDTHVIYFDGEPPCHKNGSVITGIQHMDTKQQVGEGLTCQRSFSNKPMGGYPHYYEKVVTYVNILSGPAASLDDRVTVKTFRVMRDEVDNGQFQYPDTNSSRAKIGAMADKLRGLKVGVIGLGGTGSYVLDLLAKTSVEEIHTFDGDLYQQHNAFRSPGAPCIEELDGMRSKVQYFQSIYERMHRGIIPHAEYLTSVNFNLLGGLAFIFLCVDKNVVRSILIAELLRRGIPFIDCGIGVETVDDQLIGMIRVTLVTADKQDHLRRSIALEDQQDDLYTSTIQIAELNMLAASMAVIRWKKFYPFYQDLNHEHQTTYTLNTNLLDDNERSA